MAITIQSDVEERLSRRRRGYSRVKEIVERHEAISSKQKDALTENQLIEDYLLPLFEALGWSIRKDEQGWVNSFLRADILLSYGVTIQEY